MRFIHNLQGKTILYASSRKRFIQNCDSFALLEDGVIVKTGSKKDLEGVFEKDDMASVNYLII